LAVVPLYYIIIRFVDRCMHVYLRSCIGGVQVSSCNDYRVNIAVESYGCIRGYYIYQHTWTLTLGEQLQCLREISNNKDLYAVAVMQQHNVVEHISRWMLAACSLFLHRGGSIHCFVTVLRCYSSDLQEVSCTLSFRREAIKDVKNMREVFTLIHEKQ